MKHDPSTYIGIGENGFRAIEPSPPKHEFSSIEPYGSKRSSGGIASWVAFVIIFGGVTTWLVYFFFSS